MLQEIETTNFMDLLDKSKDGEQWYGNISPGLHELVDIIKKRLKIKKDLVVAITSSQEGEGKSTLAIILGFLLDPTNFDLKKNIAYMPDGNKMRAQFDALEEDTGFVLDEAIKALYKLNFASAMQKFLNEFYQTERYQRKASFMCMSRITDFNEYFRNHKILMHIKLMKRGTAVIHIRDPDTNFDPWYLDEEKSQRKGRKRRHIADISFGERMNNERKKLTYVMDIEFDKLPNTIEKLYEKIKQDEHKKGDEAKKETTKEAIEIVKWKAIIVKLVRLIKFNLPKIKQDDIAKEMEVGKDTLKKLLEEFESSWANIVATERIRNTSPGALSVNEETPFETDIDHQGAA